MKQAGGILVYRQKGDGIEVLLLHLAGPFWAKKDVWSIPKGELDDNEDHIKAAKREFEEELGIKPPKGELLDLGTAKQGKKMNYIWAVEGDIDIKDCKFESMFTMEWPPKSGQQQEFPENDRAGWFDLASAKTKLFPAQIVFIDRLTEKLGVKTTGADGPTSEQTSLL